MQGVEAHIAEVQRGFGNKLLEQNLSKHRDNFGGENTSFHSIGVNKILHGRGIAHI